MSTASPKSPSRGRSDVASTVPELRAVLSDGQRRVRIIAKRARENFDQIVGLLNHRGPSKADQARHGVHVSEFLESARLFREVEPTTTELGRHVSQFIEHGRRTDLEALDLRLRLLDLEGTVRRTKAVMGVMMESFEKFK